MLVDSTAFPYGDRFSPVEKIVVRSLARLHGIPLAIAPIPAGLRTARANPNAMTDVTASRTLVKSPPELWTECSQAETLSRHLDSFGEIRITRLEPESAVAWEGELASGTVRLEPSGWGTRVVLTATPTPDPVAVEETVPDAPAPVEETVPDAPVPVEEVSAPAADPPAERGIGAWLRRRFGRRRQVAGPEPEPEPAVAAEAQAEAEAGPAPEPEPEPVAPMPSTVAAAAPGLDPEAALGAALDSLGRAHHRPFSRV